MPEHGPARLVVHLGLEFVLVLEPRGALRRRPRADLVDQPFEVGEFRPGGFAEHDRHAALPTPHRHIDNRLIKMPVRRRVEEVTQLLSERGEHSAPSRVTASAAGRPQTSARRSPVTQNPVRKFSSCRP